jgi:hypothetical protein
VREKAAVEVHDLVEQGEDVPDVLCPEGQLCDRRRELDSLLVLHVLLRNGTARE